MLKFNKNGKFGMLLFGDLHEHEDYATSPKCRDMQKMMVAALNEYNPDLCVMLGDVFTAKISRDDPEKFKEAIRYIFKPILDRKIPVAVIMGNHEHDPECDEDLVKCYQSIEGVLLRADGADGKADYREILYSSDGKEEKAIFWFLDSNNLCEDRSKSNYDYVHTNQIEWFENEHKKITDENSGKILPSYIFQHIPVPEEYRLLRKAKLYELPTSVRGHNTLEKNKYVGKKGTMGYVGEGPCAPDFNNGQFESWKKAGGVKAAFFGHDHLNDFSGYVDGIYIAQHKTAGFRAYTDGCRSCVRYVELDENDPGNFRWELRHFKEFGLKCESLGPIFKRVTDRQSLILHTVANISYAVAGAGALVTAAHYIKKFAEGKNG